MSSGHSALRVFVCPAPAASASPCRGQPGQAPRLSRTWPQEGAPGPPSPAALIPGSRRSSLRPEQRRWPRTPPWRAWKEPRALPVGGKRRPREAGGRRDSGSRGRGRLPRRLIPAAAGSAAGALVPCRSSPAARRSHLPSGAPFGLPEVRGAAGPPALTACSRRRRQVTLSPSWGCC